MNGLWVELWVELPVLLAGGNEIQLANIGPLIYALGIIYFSQTNVDEKSAVFLLFQFGLTIILNPSYVTCKYTLPLMFIITSTHLSCLYAKIPR